ncbi:MAG: pseudouridine synthase, partial [Luteimonas sp.]|nr:pseudouridine synthase [Luteimonas sp.]
MRAHSSEPDISLLIPDAFRGQRLDKALAAVLTDYSRSQLQQWLDAGQLTIDGGSPTRKTAVAGGERVRLWIPDAPAAGHVEPESMALDIVHEDEAILVLNKPAGLVMHPGAGNAAGTLQNGLLHYLAELAALPRAGIVHRLDKDTSGVM